VGGAGVAAGLARDVTLRAEMDLVIAFSACPQDILPINGRARQPTEAHFRIV
jgi:uncharacterized protein YcgI (DUF1989 family)